MIYEWIILGVVIALSIIIIDNYIFDYMKNLYYKIIKYITAYLFNCKCTELNEEIEQLKNKIENPQEQKLRNM